MRPNPAIQLRDLRIAQSRIGFGNRHELAIAPHPECIVSVEVGSSAMAWLCVKQYAVKRIGLDLPLPPRTPLTTGAVRRVERLQHDSLDGPGAGLLAKLGEIIPANSWDSVRHTEDICGMSQLLFYMHTTLTKRQRSRVRAIPLQQVVRENAHRNTLQ